jgi:TorA maturation chaperone TorD
MRARADLLHQLAEVRGDPTLLGAADRALAEAASRATPERVAPEHFDLFIGLGRGEMVPYDSYYLTGFLHERSLVRLRQDPVGRSPKITLRSCARIRAGLASGFLPAPWGADRALFAAHLAPWMEKFFLELQQAKTASFYRNVGVVGRLFIAIEAQAFALTARQPRSCDLL